MSTSWPQLVVRPDGHLLIDVELEVKITGLAKHQKTTLHAVTREGNSVFESCCCYTSDENGEVNLATHPSLSGSYYGVSPMGIFWSMVQAPGQREGIRLMKKDMDSPLTTNIAIYDGHLPIDSVHTCSSPEPEPLCWASVERWYKAKEAKKQVVRDGRLRGVLYLPAGDQKSIYLRWICADNTPVMSHGGPSIECPDVFGENSWSNRDLKMRPWHVSSWFLNTIAHTGEGPFPGVIDMFGTAGGILEFRSALLASRGFACLCLPYFRYEDLTENLSDLDLDYFMEAIDWMSSHTDIFHDGIGVVGVSRGAMIALLMAAHSPKISCVASINGCTFLARYPMKYKGAIVMPAVQFKLENMRNEEGAWITRDCLTYTKDDLIPVWTHDSKILNIVGEDDLSSPSECVQFMKDHFPPEKTDNFEVMSYPKAGHIIEPPYSPLTRMSYHKTWDTKFMWGGYLEPHAFAQEDSWRRILQHFNKYIPRTSNCDTRQRSSPSSL